MSPRPFIVERTGRVEAWRLRTLPGDGVDGVLLDIAGALSEFYASPDVDVLLLLGAVGATDPPSGPRGRVDDEPSDRARVGEALSARLATVSKPLIAVLDAGADADCLWLVLHCDLRIAPTDFAFAMPAVDDGVWGPMSIARLCDVVGRARALDWLWFRRTIDATEALRAGLVDLVVPRERMHDEAWAMATALTREPAIAVAAAAVKRAAVGTAAARPVAMAFWGGGVPWPDAGGLQGNGAQRWTG
jgi:enoyl-CoA hydratase/carnithine racemase